MANDSILDRLNTANSVISDFQETEEIVIPKLCAYCRNNTICSVLPIFVNVNKIGIVIGIEKCPFNQKK